RYLSRLTVDTIKIDRSFVNAISIGHDERSIIRAIITLAQSLNLDIVAEGIETTHQLDALRLLGCNNGQGFLWSRALQPDDALRWMLDESTPRTAADRGGKSVDTGGPREIGGAATGHPIVQIAHDSGQRRREPRDLSDLLRFGTLEIGLHARRAWIAGRDLNLTAKEFELLAHLATHPNQTFTRAQLLQHVWHSSAAWQSEATVTEHVYRLRNHIEPDPGRPRLLRTDRGHGYRFAA
ncbi:MAG: winged helix-turn-helix domain-containing protein, partial [Ilumatobacteraceae bacterium]